MKLECRHFLVGSLLVLSYPVSAAVTSLSGSGTAEDPYQISTTEELIWMRDQINNDQTNSFRNQHYKLM